jgi:ATP synthase protein I
MKKINEIETLKLKLEEASSKSNKDHLNKKTALHEKGSALSLALRVGVELVSAVAVGTGIGLGADYWFKTGPWLMIIFIVIGIVAGMLNVYRLASGYNYSGGYHKNKKNQERINFPNKNNEGFKD